MFFFKKPKETPEKLLKKQVFSLARRKTVQFEPEKVNIAELDAMLQTDLQTTLTKTLPPANYYRDKKSWLDCELFFDDEYTTVFVRLVVYANDKPIGATDFYKLDYDLLKALLRRFGQYI